MENHSYESPIDQLWNSIAMEAMHSYGISQLPRLLKTRSGIPQPGWADTAMESQSRYQRTVA
jgi:hypothetical protein